MGPGRISTINLTTHTSATQRPKVFCSTMVRARLLCRRLKTIREALIKAVDVTTARPAPNMLEPRLHIRKLETRRLKCPMRLR